MIKNAARKTAKKKVPIPKEPKKPKSPWVTGWTPEKVEHTLKKAVHFSGKAVNSNVAAVGVRIGSDEHTTRKSLPYVAVSVLGGGKSMPADYCTGANDATVVNIANTVLFSDPFRRYLDVVPAEVEVFRESANCLDLPFSMGTETVNMRLRQVLIPVTGDVHASFSDAYVALTPLHSPGLSFLVDRMIRQETDRAFKAAPLNDEGKMGFSMPKRLRAITGYGGSKTQNVGSFAQSMHNPLVFLAPREDQDVRKVLSLHHKGITMRELTQILDRFSTWWTARMKSRGDDGFNMDLREKERQWAISIARRALGLGHAARLALEQGIKDGLIDKLTADDVPSLLKGIVDPELRDAAWRHDFGYFIVNEMSRHRPKTVDAKGKKSRGDQLGGDELFAHLYQAVKEQAL